MNVLKLIKSFVTTVEEGNLTAAAKRLGVSKSLVSRNVRDLESYLGVRLMNRSTKALSLTSIGKSYYQEVTSIANSLGELNARVRSDGNEIIGALNILAPNGLTEILLIPFICEFSKRYKDLRVNLLLRDEVDDLSVQGFDVAIRSGQLTRQDLDFVAHKIVQNNNIVCASSEYLSSSLPINTPSDLLFHTIIEDRNLKNGEEWCFKKNDIEEKIKVSPLLSVNSIQAVKKAIRENYGVAMLPKELAIDEIENGEMTQVLGGYELKSRLVYAIYSERMNTPRKVKIFVEELKAYFAKNKKNSK